MKQQKNKALFKIFLKLLKINMSHVDIGILSLSQNYGKLKKLKTK